jgi:uncharacterized protein (DUF342 family)
MASGVHDLDAHLQLRPDERGLTGVLRVGPKIPPDQVSVSTFLMFLQSGGISPRAVDQGAIERLVEEVLATPGSEHAVVVARGKEPRDGARQLLQWVPPIATEIERINRRRDALAAENEAARKPAKAKSEPEAAVNFYEQSAFIIVQAGDILATVTPPDPGEDGEDIFGNSVPAKNSPAPSDLDPETLNLTNDHRVIALVRGRLVYSGGHRSIERTLHVPEDVGFETGNIKFPGPVEIAGGVRDRFLVRARGQVTVRKLVEASTIESERDIVLERGAAGRETGVLTAGHCLRSGYLEAVKVFCGQDCLVRHEITNCRVNVRGMIKIPSGAIRGGLVMATRGIETGIAGSVQEVRTELVVGALDELETLLRQSRGRAAETRAVLDELLARQGMYNAAKGKGKLTPEQIEAQMTMDFEIAEARRWIQELDSASERLEQNLREAIRPVLKVSQCLYGGVVVWMPGYRATFRNELKGESVIRLGPGNQPVAEYRGETHPLSKYASVEPDPRVYLLPNQGGDPSAQAA